MSKSMYYPCYTSTLSIIFNLFPVCGGGLNTGVCQGTTLVACPSPGTIFGAVSTATVYVTQTLSGITPVAASSNAFRATFTTFVANQTGTFTRNVVVQTITSSSRRKLLGGIGVSILYSVTAPSASGTALAQSIISISSIFSAGLGQTLVAAGYAGMLRYYLTCVHTK